MQIGAKLQSLYVLVQIMLYYLKTYFSKQIIRSDVFVQRQIAKHKVNLHEFFSVPLSQLDRNAPHRTARRTIADAGIVCGIT